MGMSQNWAFWMRHTSHSTRLRAALKSPVNMRFSA